MIEITDHHDGLFRLRQGPAVSFIFSKADGEHMASQLRDLGLLPVSQANQIERRYAHVQTRQLAFERKHPGHWQTVQVLFAGYQACGGEVGESESARLYLSLCHELGIAPNPNLYPPEMESFLDQL